MINIKNKLIDGTPFYLLRVGATFLCDGDLCLKIAEGYIGYGIDEEDENIHGEDLEYINAITLNNHAEVRSVSYYKNVTEVDLDIQMSLIKK